MLLSLSTVHNTILCSMRLANDLSAVGLHEIAGHRHPRRARQHARHQPRRQVVVRAVRCGQHGGVRALSTNLVNSRPVDARRLRGVGVGPRPQGQLGRPALRARRRRDEPGEGGAARAAEGRRPAQGLCAGDDGRRTAPLGLGGKLTHTPTPYPPHAFFFHTRTLQCSAPSRPFRVLPRGRTQTLCKPRKHCVRAHASC